MDEQIVRGRVIRLERRDCEVVQRDQSILDDEIIPHFALERICRRGYRKKNCNAKFGITSANMRKSRRDFLSRPYGQILLLQNLGLLKRLFLVEAKYAYCSKPVKSLTVKLLAR